jgi:hypothetical protein
VVDDRPEYLGSKAIVKRADTSQLEEFPSSAENATVANGTITSLDVRLNHVDRIDWYPTHDTRHGTADDWHQRGCNEARERAAREERSACL